MADNVTLNAGSGGPSIATDDIGGVQYQRVKACFGADGSASDVSSAVPLPVTQNAQAKATYSVTMARVATGALTANTLKQILSLEHGAGATKTLRLQKIEISGYATTALAGTVEFQLARGTAASSAGSAITPTPLNPGSAAAEAVAKSLPTITAATVVAAGNANSVPATANSSIGSAFRFHEFLAGADAQPFTLRAGNLDTLVLSIISTAAINVTLNITAYFAEE